MVVPTIDTELQILADQSDRFKEHNIHLILSESKFISKCRDKRLINIFFQDHDICIPRKIDKRNLTFPVFIKPYDGSLSKDIFLINKESEITDYHLNNDKLMFMEYIDPINNHEYTIDMYYGGDNFVKCIVPRKRIEVRAGEISKGVTIKNEIISFLKERLDYIEGAVGCITLQLFFNVHTKNILGIEINPRFGGGFPLSYLAGGNFPRWLINEYFFGKTCSYQENWEENLLMLRYDDEVIVHGFEN